MIKVVESDLATQRAKLSTPVADPTDLAAAILLALASAQSFLSGLPPQMHQHTRDFIAERKLPGHLEVLEGLKERQELVINFRGELKQSCVDLAEMDRADEIIAAVREDVGA